METLKNINNINQWVVRQICDFALNIVKGFIFHRVYLLLIWEPIVLAYSIHTDDCEW